MANEYDQPRVVHIWHAGRTLLQYKVVEEELPDSEDTGAGAGAGAGAGGGAGAPEN